MTKARIFTPANRLAKALNGAEGGTRGELLQAAEQRLEDMAPAIRMVVRRNVLQIAASAARDDAAIRAEAPGLMHAAIEIANVAVSAELAALGEIARGFAVLMDGCARDGIWRRDVYQLHVDALKLVDSRGGDAKIYEHMVEDLSRVREAIGVIG